VGNQGDFDEEEFDVPFYQHYYVAVEVVDIGATNAEG